MQIYVIHSKGRNIQTKCAVICNLEICSNIQVILTTCVYANVYDGRNMPNMCSYAIEKYAIICKNRDGIHPPVFVILAVK